MAMVKRAGSVLILGAVTAATTGLAAWTVKPGGAVMTSSATVTLTDTTTGASLPCSSSSATGSLKSGSGLSGSGIGKLTSWSFPGCTMGFTVTASHFPWLLNTVSFDSTTGVTTATITGIHALLGGPCAAIIDGTTAAADNGKVTVSYTNSTGKLRVRTTGSTLHFYMSTCSGIHSGDHATLSASYPVIPRQTITSP